MGVVMWYGCGFGLNLTTIYMVIYLIDLAKFVLRIFAIGVMPWHSLLPMALITES